MHTCSNFVECTYTLFSYQNDTYECIRIIIIRPLKNLRFYLNKISLHVHILSLLLAESFMMTECQGSMMYIACDRNHVIVVETAHYGSIANSTCDHDVFNETCVSSRARHTVAHRCSGRNACSIFVSADVASAECDSETSGLSVAYRCVLGTTCVLRVTPL